MTHGNFKRYVCSVLSILFLVTSIPNAAFAGMIPNQQLAAGNALEQQREEVREFVARKDVQEELTALGVEPHAAVERVDSMTAEEVAALHGKLAELPAGEGILETVVLVLLVLILLDVAGVTDVFSGL